MKDHLIIDRHVCAWMDNVQRYDRLIGKLGSVRIQRGYQLWRTLYFVVDEALMVQHFDREALQGVHKAIKRQSIHLLFEQAQ